MQHVKVRLSPPRNTKMKLLFCGTLDGDLVEIHQFLNVYRENFLQIILSLKQKEISNCKTILL